MVVLFFGFLGLGNTRFDASPHCPASEGIEKQVSGFQEQVHS